MSATSGSPISPGSAGNWRHRSRRTYDLGPCSQEPLESRKRICRSCRTFAEPTCSPRRHRRTALPGAVHYGASSSPAASAPAPKGRTPCVAAALHVGSCRPRGAHREPCREHFTACTCHALPRRCMSFYTRRRPRTGLRLCCGGCETEQDDGFSRVLIDGAPPDVTRRRPHGARRASPGGFWVTD